MKLVYQAAASALAGRGLEDNKIKSMKNNLQRCPAGFTLVEIMIVTAIIALLAMIAIPNFVKARAASQANSCMNNLRQLDSAASQFALEQHKTTGDAINFPNDLTPYIKMNSGGSLPACPAGGTYDCPAVGTNATCTYSTLTPPHKIW